MSHRFAGITLAAVFLVSCAGRSGGMLPAASPVLAPRSAPQIAASAKHRRLVRATFTVKWKHPHQRKHVGAHYLPVTARSASIAVNGGVLQYLNAPATTIAVFAPPGTDTFDVAIYDEQNGLGNVLAEAEATKAIVAGGKNSIAVTTNGVVASLALSLSPRPPAGKAATIKVSVTAMDPDGNVIVSPGDYSTPVHLSVSDPSNSGTLALTAKVLQNPSAAANLAYNGGNVWSAVVTASAAGASSSSETFAPVVTVGEIAASPTIGSSPQWITTGSDGHIWYTEAGTNDKIAALKSTLTEYTIPTSASNPQGIIAGSDGRLWFTEYAGSKIAAVTTSGTFTEFGTLFVSDGPLLLVDRGDGNVWYSGNEGDHAGYQGITSGVAGETTLPTGAAAPFGVAAAPDLNLYFTESAVDKVARIDNLFGTFTETALTAGSTPEQMVRGPDGNLWFTENGRSRIGVLSPGCFCIAAEYPTLTPNAFPVGITVGRDGALWFTENGLSRIGRITTSGVVTEYEVPTSNAGLKGITAFSNGTIFATESSVNKIASLNY